MTKVEYLNKLQEKLQKFSNELQSEIMDDYMQHFAEGEQLGKNDEEIIAELGNIEDMIRDLPEDEVVQNVATVWSERNTGTENKGNADGNMAENESSLAEIVEAESSKQNSYDGIYSEIAVDGLVADVTVTESTDGRIYVDYKNNGDLDCQLKYEFYQYEENGVFHVGVRRREGVAGNNRKTISFFGKTISFENVFNRDVNTDISLNVKVPTGMEKIVVKTSCGEMKIYAVHAASMMLSTGSGDMDVRDVEVDNFKLNTASGEAHLEKNRFVSAMMNTASGDLNMHMVETEKLNANTASGDLSMKVVKAGSLKLNTASGDIDISDVEALSVGVNSASGDICGKHIVVQEFINCSTASGDVDMEGSAGSFKFGSGSGDLTARCSGMLQSVSASTGSGDVDLVLEGITGMEITTKVQSGDVDIRWKGQESCVKNATSTFGDGSCNVQVKTGSGDVSVECR